MLPVLALVKVASSGTIKIRQYKNPLQVLK